jgi:hypothetical protein
MKFGLLNQLKLLYFSLLMISLSYFDNENNKEKTKIRISSKIRIPPQSTKYIPVKLSNVNKHECTGQTS